MSDQFEILVLLLLLFIASYLGHIADALRDISRKLRG